MRRLDVSINMDGDVQVIVAGDGDGRPQMMHLTVREAIRLRNLIGSVLEIDGAHAGPSAGMA